MHRPPNIQWARLVRLNRIVRQYRNRRTPGSPRFDAQYIRRELLYLITSRDFNTFDVWVKGLLIGIYDAIDSYIKYGVEL